MHVPLLDLKAQYRTTKSEIMTAIEAVCDEQGFILGPRVLELERAIAHYVGSAHAVGCASGTDAILLALMAVGVGHGDEVITVPFTFFATTGSISRLGAKPVLVDIKADSFNIDPAQIEKKITAKTKAIIPVHLFGQCAEMEAITAIARKKTIPVIEDAAQAIGAARHGTKAGVLGAMGCFSFFPSKNLGGFGDGGMVTTDDKALADSLASLRVHGSKAKYVHDQIGFNSRLDALQAAILRVKLNHLDAWAEGRRANAVRYEGLFKEAKLADHVTLPATTPGNHHVFNQFTIRARKRDALRDYLKEQGIGSEVYYPIPMHLQNCYKNLGHMKGDFPVSERASEEVLSLPIYAELTAEQQTYVVQTIAAFYRHH
ncbi:MAG: DegT/DnrJ/EryC1/StrS family aminotransferase [Nitrospira sp.]